MFISVIYSPYLDLIAIIYLRLISSEEGKEKKGEEEEKEEGKLLLLEIIR